MDGETRNGANRNITATTFHPTCAGDGKEDPPTIRRHFFILQHADRICLVIILLPRKGLPLRPQVLPHQFTKILTTQIMRMKGKMAMSEKSIAMNQKAIFTGKVAGSEIKDTLPRAEQDRPLLLTVT